MNAQERTAKYGLKHLHDTRTRDRRFRENALREIMERQPEPLDSNQEDMKSNDE